MGGIDIAHAERRVSQVVHIFLAQGQTHTQGACIQTLGQISSIVRQGDT